MKKLMILLCVFFAIAAHAQVPDTTYYLSTIVAEKSKYIGKKFEELEKDLKIKIVYFAPQTNIYHDISKETSTRFYFIVPEYGEDFKSNYIEIYWEPYLDADKSGDIFREAPDDSNWTAEAKAFYSKGVIKDIKTR